MRKIAILLGLLFITVINYGQQNSFDVTKGTIRKYLYMVPNASAPAAPLLGMLYFDTDTTLYYYDGLTWQPLGGGGDSYWTLTGDTIKTVYNVKVDSSFMMDYDSVYFGYTEWPNGIEDGLSPGALMKIRDKDSTAFISVGRSIPGADNLYEARMYAGIETQPPGQELNTPSADIQVRFHNGNDQDTAQVLISTRDGDGNSGIDVTSTSITISSDSTYFTDSIYFERDAIPHLKTMEPVGDPLVLRKIGATTKRQLAQTTWGNFFDTMMVAVAAEPTEYTTWVRDTANNEIEYSNKKDKISELKTNERDQKAMISFTFDDCKLTDYTIIKPLFLAKSIRSTHYVILNNIGTGGYLSLSQIKDMYNDGFEIGCHSKTHTDFTTITYDSICSELNTCKNYFANQDITVNNLAYPYNEFNDTAMMAARKYFRSARASFDDGDTLNHDIITTYALRSVAADDYTDSVFYRQMIDKAYNEKQWLIFYIHMVDSDDSAMIANLIDYAQNRDIEIKTVNEALNEYSNQLDISQDFAVKNGNVRLDGSIFRQDRYRGENYVPYIHTFSDATATGFNQFVGWNSGNMTMKIKDGNATKTSFNTGAGAYTLYSLTTGYMNTAIGSYVLKNDTSGYANTGIGYNSMLNIKSGHNNVALGDYSLNSSISGNYNVAIGSSGGYYQMGEKNTIVGTSAAIGYSGRSNTNGISAFGYEALNVIRSGSGNSAFGYQALGSDTTGSYNCAFGYQALTSVISEDGNSAFGYNSARYLKGKRNTCYGAYAGMGSSGNSNNDQNTFFGYYAGIYLGNGENNTGIGNQSMVSTSGDRITGSGNTAIGSFSLSQIKSGGSNTAIGMFSLYSNTTGVGNVAIGYQSAYNETGSNKLYIENSNSTAPLLYGEFDNDIFKVNGTQVYPTGTIADNDATPDVSAKNVWIYAGSANAVTVTDLDNPDVGAIYTLIGNSDTYTVTIADSGNFKLSAQWVGGLDDVITLFCVADNNYVEISRSNN